MLDGRCVTRGVGSQRNTGPVDRRRLLRTICEIWLVSLVSNPPWYQSTAARHARHDPMGRSKPAPAPKVQIVRREVCAMTSELAKRTPPVAWTNARDEPPAPCERCGPAVMA